MKSCAKESGKEIHVLSISNKKGSITESRRSHISQNFRITNQMSSNTRFIKSDVWYMSGEHKTQSELGNYV